MIVIKQLLGFLFGGLIRALYESWKKDGVDKDVQAIVKEMVGLAEQLLGSGTGAQKKEYAFSKIKSRTLAIGKKLRDRTINQLIEAAVEFYHPVEVQ